MLKIKPSTHINLRI